MIEPIKVYRYIRSLKTSLDTIGREGWRLIRDEALGQYLPPKPYVIQFPVNDICNSRCVMCNIWHRKRDSRVYSIEEIRQILTDPLFTEIRYVGMSGGEPTLRRDHAHNC